MSEDHADRGQLTRQFSIALLIGTQLFVCWLSLLLWKGFYSFTEATVNLSQFSFAVSLIVACVIWRKWYLICTTSGVMIDVIAYGLSEVREHWVMQVRGSGSDHVPPMLLLLINVQFYAVLTAQCFILAGSVGFLRDVWLGRYKCGSARAATPTR